MNVPLNESTRGFFNQQYFDMMKKESVLVKCANFSAGSMKKLTHWWISTARGGVIDEAALIKAIQENKIYSVGLDVVRISSMTC